MQKTVDFVALDKHHSMNPVYIPASSFEQWRQFTAQPDLHWVEGRSAMETAKAWHNTTGFPAPVERMFRAAGEPFASLKPLLVIPEHKVPLEGGNRDSQNDVWVLASHEKGLASITVEGKVDETFGERLAAWYKNPSSGKKTRLQFLKDTIGLSDLSAQHNGNIRYQLLHRAASALIEAKRFWADTAVMLVHSFSDQDIGLEDFRAFTQLFGVSPLPDQLVPLRRPSGIPLYAAWIRDPLEPTI
jgi:hypothetical protein